MLGEAEDVMVAEREAVGELLLVADMDSTLRVGVPELLGVCEEEPVLDGV